MEIFKEELQMLWDVKCPKCNSDILNKNGKYRGRQRFICLDCGYSFTTYSKSILDSTKLSENQWQMIVRGIINNQTLATLSKEVKVSLISLSRIRRNILDLLLPLNRYSKLLKKYYYNPFDTSTIFIPNMERGVIYYCDYNESMIITITEYHKGIYISYAYPKREFNSLMSDVNYEKLDFISSKEVTNIDAISYLDGLLKFLKGYRGIKAELLSRYCVFYDFKTNLSEEEFTNLVIAHIGLHKKRND